MAHGFSLPLPKLCFRQCWRWPNFVLRIFRQQRDVRTADVECTDNNGKRKQERFLLNGKRMRTWREAVDSVGDEGKPAYARREAVSTPA